MPFGHVASHFGTGISVVLSPPATIENQKSVPYVGGCMTRDKLDRRAFVGVTSTLLLSGCTRCQRAQRAPSLQEAGEQGAKPHAEGGQAKEMSQESSLQKIVEIERDLGGSVGVFAHLPATGWTLSHHATERYAMCSTFKWVLAAAILERVDAGVIRLESEIQFGEDDLLEWAPVAKERLAEGKLTVSEMCRAAVTFSDNTAANLLLDRVGGPAGLTEFFRRMGDDVSRLDRDEPMLNMNTPGDPRDTTSPRAMATLLQRVLTGGVLKSNSVATLIEWLRATQTGQDRLRAGLPDDVELAHKTGSGNRGAVNDVGVFGTKAGDPCFVAVYLSGSERPMNELEAAHAQIASLIAGEVL
jgi:beta-lactamase class A